VIVRDGDMAFVLHDGRGIGFNLKQISKVAIESAERVYGGSKDEMLLSVYVSGHCTNMTVSRDELRQLFSDSPWIKAVPK